MTVVLDLDEEGRVMRSALGSELAGTEAAKCVERAILERAEFPGRGPATRIPVLVQVAPP